MKKPVILCVDDEQMILSNLEDQLSKEFGDEYDIELAESGEEGLEIIDEMNEDGRPIALIISDQLMPKMKGEEFIIRAHKKIPHTLKILLTGQASLESVSRVINEAQLFRYIPKPWQVADLIGAAREATAFFLDYLKLLQFTQLLKSLNETSQKLTGEIDQMRIVNTFIQSAVNTIGVEKGYIILTKDQEQLYDEAGIYQPNKYIQFNREMTYKVEDLTKEVATLVEEKLNTKTKEDPSTIATPLRYKDKNMGYVYLENAFSQNKFSESQREILEMLATHTAISMENAALYERLSQKNEDILDSIRYAKRIQEALMPREDELEDLFDDYMVYYRAKDIVSGDFYWWQIRGKVVSLAAVDCTGHGVPGAFMSVIGSSYLNQIAGMGPKPDPGMMLNLMHKRVQDTLHRQGIQTGLRDGMDLALTVIDLEAKKLKFSGARRPLWVLRGDELLQFKATKCSIGEMDVANKDVQFSAQAMDLQTGDRIFLFTDGIEDQFGGAEGGSDEEKRFSRKRLQDFLISSSKKPLKDVRNDLVKAIDGWRGEQELTDDNLLIALQVS